ncbi:hypothetical protein NEOC65_001429 [Neochlamydia sp. AcF65]|nr:hypothetical protein [Neochlamydia sp. AcF65]
MLLKLFGGPCSKNLFEVFQRVSVRPTNCHGISFLSFKNEAYSAQSLNL